MRREGKKEKGKTKKRKKEREKEREGANKIHSGDRGASRAREAAGRHAAPYAEQEKERDGTAIEYGYRDVKNRREGFLGN
jgi:hypothetical protein